LKEKVTKKFKDNPIALPKMFGIFRACARQKPPMTKTLLANRNLAGASRQFSHHRLFFYPGMLWEGG
jgi:hypothetical protein